MKIILKILAIWIFIIILGLWIFPGKSDLRIKEDNKSICYTEWYWFSFRTTEHCYLLK